MDVNRHGHRLVECKTAAAIAILYYHVVTFARGVHIYTACSALEINKHSLVSFGGNRAGLRTGQTGHVPSGLHYKGPPQGQTFKIIFLGCISYLSTFSSYIIIAIFILKSIDKIVPVQNSKQSVKRLQILRKSRTMT